MRFAIIGGDMRMVHLCRLLADDGHEVRAFGLEKAGHIESVFTAVSVSAAANGADCVVLPLPATGQRGFLNTPLSSGEYTMEEIIASIEPGTMVCAGRIDADTTAQANKRGIYPIDYFKREELVIYNAVATSEGAIGLIMQETPNTLWNSRVLVIGFGHVGKLLAHRLRGMGAIVSVSSRKCEDMAWCRAYGYKVLDTRALEGRLGGFDVVVNTVPAMVLGEGRLRELKPKALCMDLASKPGGMDFAAASRLGVHAVWALSLPGEVAPDSAGCIIKDTILNILAEQERGTG